MLSMRELRRAVGILGVSIPGCRLKRIIQMDAFSLVFNCVDARKVRTDVLLSCDYEFACIGALEANGRRNAPAGSFHEFMRANMTGAVVAGVSISSANRQVCLELSNRSVRWNLYLSILGARSNIYVTDEQGRLLHSMKPCEETRRDLKIGSFWKDPPGSVPSEGEDRWQQVPDDAYLETIGKEYLLSVTRRDADTLANAILHALKKERNQLGRKLSRLHEDLANANQADDFRMKGELLKTVLHEIQPGDDRVTVTDYATGGTVEIPLEPQISPAENLKKYFKRYQKGSRGKAIIHQQIEKMEELRNALDSTEKRVHAAIEKEPPSVEELEALESRPLVGRLIARYGPKRAGGGSRKQGNTENGIPKRLQPRRYRTEDGLEIWVGRSDEGNDYLTTRLARGNDLFFHLEGYPGSHVVLRTEGRSDPPPGSVLEACELAIHFSKLKNAGDADVHVAPVKNVKKPKGAKPGLVYVRQGRTIHLRRDPGRLENILASRLER